MTKLTPFGQDKIKKKAITRQYLLRLWRNGYEELYEESYPDAWKKEKKWFTLNYVDIAILENLHKMTLIDIGQFIYWIWHWKAPQLQNKIKMLRQALHFIEEFKDWRIKTVEIRSKIGMEELCKRYMVKNYANLVYGKSRVIGWRKDADS